ncbi:MAG TPA: MFS transporter [Gaiellaceae bacterium]|nr:MFS transporter [Gaiellaceae bacterium]
MSAIPLRERLGPLVEREYRLLFAATTITTLGDAIAAIALAFAVLDLHGAGATDLGIVIATRQGANAAVLVLGGVLSDRLPRQRVLAAASLVQGGAQAATAGFVLTGRASIALLTGLQALYGAGQGFVLPAEIGLVPQTVSAERLQQANALRGLTRNLLWVIGPAVGGAIVVAGSPGLALLIDAATFAAAAALLARIVLVPRVALATSRFFGELREGWREFVSRTWLWAAVVLFGVGNVFFMFWNVLGPVVAKEDLDGAGAWATILVANGAGAVAGGVLAYRLRPERPMVAAVAWPMLYALQPASLAAGAPTWLVSGAAFVGGFAIAVHLTLWVTILQHEVPEHARSRVSSYDALGSFVLTPLGTAIAGPLAAGLGTANALWLAASVALATSGSILLIPSVWSIRRRQAATTLGA